MTENKRILLPSSSGSYTAYFRCQQTIVLCTHLSCCLFKSVGLSIPWPIDEFFHKHFLPVCLHLIFNLCKSVCPNFHSPLFWGPPKECFRVSVQLSSYNIWIMQQDGSILGCSGVNWIRLSITVGHQCHQSHTHHAALQSCGVRDLTEDLEHLCQMC